MRVALAAAAVFLASSATCFADDAYFPAQNGATWSYDRTSKTDAVGVSVVTASNVVTGTCRAKTTVGGEACWLVEWKESGDESATEFTCKMWVRGEAESGGGVKT